MSTHKKLHTWFKEMGYTQKAVAEKLNTTPATISRIFKGQIKLSFEFLQKIKDEFPHFEIQEFLETETHNQVNETQEEYGASTEALIKQMRKILDVLEERMTQKRHNDKPNN